MSQKALAKFGIPGGKNEGQYMIRWSVPPDIQSAFKHVRFTALGTVGFPTAIYCNRALVKPLEAGLRSLISAGLAHEMKTWDGCYIIRNQRGGSQYSMHAWGLAFDNNAATNRLGAPPTLSPAYVKCFTDQGFFWGGHWKHKDGMHFELINF